jgi:thiol:disulfide interchange protein DsbD
VRTALACVLLAAAPSVLAQQSGVGGLQGRLGALLGNSNEEQLLDPEQAFRLTASAPASGRLLVQLTPASGYYLYRDKLRFRLRDADGISIKSIKLPAGEMKLDPTFGKTEVYKTPVPVELSLAAAAGARKLTLVASYQGCNEKRGVCYPPVEKAVNLVLP